MTFATDWLSASVMLGSGLLVGGLFIWFLYTSAFPKRDEGLAEEKLRLADLVDRRDGLIVKLRELDNSESEADREERGRLELEAADVIRQLEDGLRGVAKKPEPVIEKPVETVAKTEIKRAARRGFLWGASSTAALALLGFFVYSSATDRAPSGSPTGGQPMAGAPAAEAPQPANPQAEAELKALQAKVAQNPDDINARLDLARGYMEREDLMAVFKETQAVLDKEPKNARALTYQALVRMSMGQSEQAVTMLKAATVSDPDLIDGWVGLGWAYAASGRAAEADAAIREAIKRHPDQEQRLTQLVEEMHRRAAQGPATAAAAASAESPAAGPMSGGGPMAGGGGGAAAAGGPSLEITVDIDASAKSRVSSSGVLFVFARAEGVASGPPLAVKRLAATQFPMTISLSAADSMMGQALPPKVRLEARLDSDGNAMTKDPSDPKAVVDSAVIGGPPVTLKLQ